MPELDIGQSTTTNLKGTVKNFIVNPQTLDSTGTGTTEIKWSYPDANTNLGYFKTIPEIKSGLKALSIYVCGQGITANAKDKVTIDNIIGGGADNFVKICQSLLIDKKIHGDAFVEIVRIGDSKTGKVVNLKPIYPGDMTVYWSPEGLIDKYEVQTNTPGGKPVTFQPHEILHLTNDRVSNEIHGTSIIDSLKFIIDAKNEALSDERKIRHRELAMGILELDTDDPGKIKSAITAYENAVKNGEVLVTVKGASEIKNNPNAPRDRIQWLQYLDNLFYQIIGIPKVIATSEGYTEAGAKVGVFTFDPVYTSEQRDMEAEIFSQVGIIVTFEPAPSLGGTLQQSEEANTGQTAFQPNDVEATITKE